MRDEDPDHLSDALAKEADELERESSQLESQIEETRQDWEGKRRDDGVPGAPPPRQGDKPDGPHEPPEASERG